MSLKLGMLGAALAAAVACPPVAAAEPVWPVAGAEDAQATIDDLQAQGYDTQINWVSGLPSVQLYRCKVTAIHNPNHSPPTGHTGSAAATGGHATAAASAAPSIPSLSDMAVLPTRRVVGQACARRL